MQDENYPRDLLGYGATPPDPQWPGKARVESRRDPRVDLTE
mgnify:CR=1 FL=1